MILIEVGKRYTFLIGALIGLLISLVFGLATYPWENPYFEGRAGYHMLLMKLIAPIIMFSTGVLFVVVNLLIKKKKNQKIGGNKG